MNDEPLNILIAEPPDDPRRSVLTALAGAAITLDLHSVGTLPRLMNALATRAYDCALVDTRIPDLDAKALAAELKAIGVDTPLIVIDEAMKPAQALDLLSAGVSDCIMHAEISATRLSCSVANATQRHKMEHRLTKAERSLTTKGGQDSVTKLPNRALFMERLERALSLAQRNGKQIAVLLIDINGFRKVNHSSGHAIADKLLAELAERLQASLQGPESLARIGNNEFAVLLPIGASLAGAVASATHLQQTLAKPFNFDGRDISIGGAIGIALFPLHGANMDSLMRAADIAMRTAKRSGVGFMVYSGEDDEGGADQLALANDLRLALEHQQFEAHFQPKISMRQQRVLGFEALLRWRHARQGMVSPDIFIPLAEQIGMIEPLTHWVLDRALQHCSEWARRDPTLTVAVNLSALTLHNREFPEMVANLLDKWRIKPDRLVLEITESAIILDAVRAADTLTRLHDMGVQISIDDFGTGYTSLAYIRKLPVTELKIDKSYVMNMRTSNDDAVIVRTIIDLAHNLDLKIVAEGVEDVAVFNILAELGCDTVQGYYLGRPMAPAAVEEWLTTSPWGLAQPERMVAMTGG